MLYDKYQELFKAGKIKTGFSPRFPDYATKFWIEHLEKNLNSVRKNNFLDLGAGCGRLTQLLISAGFKSGTAVEVQVDKKIWNQITLEHQRIRLIEGDFLKVLPTLSKQFDFVILAEVFEHIHPSQIKQFLKEINRILTPEGSIFLTTPNATFCGPAEESPQWVGRHPYGHHQHYTYKSIKEILASGGFKAVHHSFECGPLKKKIYNKLFYYSARTDQRFLMSQKLSPAIRKAYRFSSMPFAFAAKGFFKMLAQAVHWHENKFCCEKNSQTMMLAIKKQKL
jgi:2-polyprenyl-3-methyl-5-hydroxy-6-metoxy-1,4-benzoquinol methylase